MLHHLPEVCGGERLDGVDGAVARVVVIHLVLGERHLGVLLIVRPDPVDGELYLGPAAQWVERLSQWITSLGWAAGWELQIEKQFV